MLIITRKSNQSIIINGNIKVTNLGVNRQNQCKFGIEAPRDIPVHREEIQERINNESKLK